MDNPFKFDPDNAITNSEAMTGNRPVEDSEEARLNNQRNSARLADETSKALFNPINEGGDYRPGGVHDAPRLPENMQVLGPAPVDTEKQRNQQYNQDLYNSLGEPIFGIEGAPRVMERTDAKGNRSKEFVMPPDLVAGEEPILEGATRATLSGATKFAKSAAGFGEWLLDVTQQASKDMEKNPEKRVMVGPIASAGGDAIRAMAELMDHWLGTNLSDSEKNWIDSNFPTFPGANNLEDFLATTGSMVIGGGIGKKAADVTVGDAVGEFLQHAKDVNPGTAKAATETFGRVLASVVGEAAGVGATTPANTEAITGNHFLDNLILGGAFAGVGGAIGSGARWLDKAPLAGFNNRPDWEKATVSFMNLVDPTTKTMAPKGTIDRARVLGSILSENSTLETGLEGVLNGTIKIDSPAALALNGAAQKYVRTVNRGPLSDEFVDAEAQRILQNLIGLKRSRVAGHSPLIEASDADVNAKIENLMSEKANNILDQGMAEQAGLQQGQTVLDDLNAARGNLVRTDAARARAESDLLVEQNDNALRKAIEDFRQNDPVGFNTAGREDLQNMSIEGLMSAWKRDKAEVDAAYKAIPREKYDYAKLADRIIDAGQEDAALEALQVVPGERMVRRIEGIGPDAEAVAVDMAQKRADLIDTLRERFPDINSLWNEGRSRLSQVIDQTITSGTGKRVDQGLSIRNAIDEIVNGVDNPAVVRAQQRYSQFANTWNKTDSLKNLSETMSQVRDTGRNVVQAQQAAYDVLQKAVTNPSGLDTEPLLAAVRNPELEPTLRKYLVGEVLSRLSTDMNTEQLIGALQPFKNIIHNIDPSLEANLAQTIKILGSKEADVAAKTAASVQAKSIANEVMHSAMDEEASIFINRLDQTTNALGAGPELTGNPSAKFAELFSSKDAITRIPKLMAEARAEGNELAVEGIKSQYLRWLKDKVFSSRAIGIDVAGEDLTAAMAPRTGNLKSMVEGSFDNTFETLEKVFEDDPTTAGAVRSMLEFMHIKVNLDTAKAFTKGSDTSSNLASAYEAAKNVGVGFFGPLSRQGHLWNRIWKLITGDSDEAARSAMNDMIDVLIVDPSFIKKAADKATGDDRGGLERAWSAAVIAGKKITQGKMGYDKEENSPADPMKFAETIGNGTVTDANTSMANQLVDQTFSALGEHGSIFNTAKGRPVSTNIEDRRPKTRDDLAFPNNFQKGQFLTDSFERARTRDYPAHTFDSDWMDTPPSSRGFSKKPNDRER